MRQTMRLPRRKPAMRELARAKSMARHPVNRRRAPTHRREKVAVKSG